MNFTQKLDLLMKQRGLNKNTLAKLSGVPYTTIDGFYKKGYENTKLSTLNKLCSCLDVSLDYLAKDSESPSITSMPLNYSQDELEVVNAYHKADPPTQRAVRRVLDLPLAPNPTANLDIDTEVDSYRQELLRQKKAAEESSASSTTAAREA